MGSLEKSKIDDTNDVPTDCNILWRLVSKYYVCSDCRTRAISWIKIRVVVLGKIEHLGPVRNCGRRKDTRGITLVSVELLVDGADSGPALDAVALCYDIFSSIVSSVGPPPRSGGGMWRRPPTVPIGISPRSDITIIGRLQCLFSDFVGDPSNMLVVPEP